MGDFWSGNPFVLEGLQEIQALLLDIFSKGNSPPGQALIEMVLADAKWLRPGFFLVCAGFGTMERRKMIDIGAAIEMLHMATLIHDDVIDRSVTRRGIPSFYARFGMRDAVLTGDYLFSKALLLVSPYANPSNTNLFTDTISRLSLSELNQSAQRYRMTFQVREYLRRIMGKTAALFSLSCSLGGLESGLEPAVFRTMAKAGYSIGMAFQIIDDILDYTGSPGEIKKPSGNDLKEGIFTLPLIYALKNNPASLSRHLDKRPYSSSRIKKIIRLVETAGGIDSARIIAGKYTSHAQKEIQRLPENQFRKIFSQSAEKLLMRNY